MILIIPASLRGIWLTWYLFDSIKLYESIYFIKILVLIFILLSPLIIWFKKANINNWRFGLWSIRRIWLLPFITTQILCLSALNRSWLNFKIFDRGRLKLSIRLFQSIYFINKITFSIKFIYKILIIFVIWLVIIFIIYICKL